MRAVSERRVDPRVPASLTIKVVEPDGRTPKLTLETIDISAGGAFCRTGESIPLRSQVRIRITFPSDKSSPPILLDAVVLRSDKETLTGSGEGGFLIALFFLNLQFDDRRRLQQFVLASIGTSATEA